jgi:hypothetical protein
LKRGAGGSPLFPPNEGAPLREAVLKVLSQSPYRYGIERSRWHLASLLQVLDIAVKSRAGLWNVLQRLDLRFRKGWDYWVRTDPLAEVKLEYLKAVLERGRLFPEQVCVLWLDEFTFYRLPRPAPAWSDGQTPRGPKTQLTPGNNTKARIGAVMNHFTGQVYTLLRSSFGADHLIHFYRDIRQLYPEVSEIYVIQDCWPVHLLPQVCQAACGLGISILPLPTYSSWRNPIEKLWRWLRQSVLHMHPWADDWPRLKLEVSRFLDRFSQPSPTLLHYVGLLSD